MSKHYDERFNLNKEMEFLEQKVEVLDTSVFITSANEARLLQPTNIQEYIDTVCNNQMPSEATRAFVRASGTDNILQIFVESNSRYITKIVMQQIVTKILRTHGRTTYVVDERLFGIEHLKQDDYMAYLEVLSQSSTVDIECKSDVIHMVDSLNPNHMIFMLKDLSENKVVGCGTLFIEQNLIHTFGTVAHIEDVAIGTAYRGCGFGKIMIEKLTNIAKMMGCYKIILDTSDKNNALMNERI